MLFSQSESCRPEGKASGRAEWPETPHLRERRSQIVEKFVTSLKVAIPLGGEDQRAACKPAITGAIDERPQSERNDLRMGNGRIRSNRYLDDSAP